MASVARNKVMLACTECKQRNYNSMKNKKNTPDRIELNKYCRLQEAYGSSRNQVMSKWLACEWSEKP
mgnify:CR=1 FL=1